MELSLLAGPFFYPDLASNNILVQSNQYAARSACGRFAFDPHCPSGRQQMQRGESRAKGPKRGARTRAGTTKLKTRAGRKDASGTSQDKKRRPRTLELNEIIQRRVSTSE